MSSSFKRRGTKKVVSAQPPSSYNSPPSSSAASISISVTDSVGLANPSSSPPQLHQPTQRTVASSLLPGTRPWTSNLTVTSFGLREIDSFLFSPGGGGGGGGQPLQTLVLLEEDRLDDLWRALCRYWCAEGVTQRQVVILPSLLPSADKSLQLFDDNEDDYDGGGVSRNFNNEGSSPEELRDFVLSLPRNLHLDKLRSKATTTTATKTKQSSSTIASSSSDESRNGMNNMMMTNHGREAITAIVEEDEYDDDDGDNDKNDIEGDTHGNGASSDEGLINAWQYRKSIQIERSGIGNQKVGSDLVLGAEDGVYCHSYDLSQRMWDQFYPNDGSFVEDARDNPLLTNTRIVDCSRSLITSHKSMHIQHQGMALFCTLWKHIQSELSTHQNRVIRLFLHRLPVGQGCIALSLLMAKIRKENLPVVVLATIRPWRWLTNNNFNDINSKIDMLLSLRNIADTALSLDSFSSLRTPPPPEFSLLQGILTVHKCASSTVSHYTDTVTNKRPLADRFGVKRDGRKVTVQLLHLPPEEYSKSGSSTVGGDRSGGGIHIISNSAAASDGSNRKEHHRHGHDNMTTTTVMGCSSFGGGEGPSLEF